MKSYLKCLFIFCTSFIYSQNSNYDDYPKQIFNYNYRCSFSRTYSYDFDLKQSSTSYPVNYILIIEINDEGTGRLVSAFNGEKTITTITSCYRHKDYYEINSVNKYGFNFTGILTFKNNVFEQFYIKNKENVAIVFE